MDCESRPLDPQALSVLHAPAVKHPYISYAISEEMVTNLCDFYIRRTGKLYFERPELLKIYEQEAVIFADLLKWSEAQMFRELAALKKEVESVMLWSATKK